MHRLPALLAVLAICASHPVRAKELPSFLVAGDAFCTREADYDDLAAHGQGRPGSAVETCLTIDAPTRVAIIGGQATVKTMVRVTDGPYAYTVGWTNGALPLAR